MSFQSGGQFGSLLFHLVQTQKFLPFGFSQVDSHLAKDYTYLPL